MLRDFIMTTGALKRLRTDQNGVVSFEYVIVATCIMAAVGAAFGTDAGLGIANALTSMITSISNAINAAIA